MAEETYIGEYKGHVIYYYRYVEGGVYGYDGVSRYYNTLAELYAAIDKLEAPPAKKDVGPQEPTKETRTPFMVYREVTVYSDEDLPGLFFSVYGAEYSTLLGESDARRIIDAMLGAPGPGEEGYVYVSPLEPVPLSLPAEWSWLTGPLNWFKTVLEGIGSGIGGAVSGLGTAIGGIGQAFIDSLGGVGKSLEAPLADIGSATLDTVLKASSEHSPDPKTQEKIKQLMEQLKASQEAIIKTIHQSPGDPTGAPQASSLLATALLGVSLAAETAGALFDILHPIKDLGAQRISERVVDSMGAHELVGAIIGMPTQIGLLPQLKYFYNSVYQPSIPPYQDLINQVVKEVITLDEFKKQMAYQGFSADWSQKIWDAHFIPPNWAQILQAYYRGAITEEQMRAMQILVDLDPRYKSVWDAQIEVIPGVQDLINMRMKEVVGQTFFEKHLQWHGYDKSWAAKIWDAHFIPPSLSDILTAWRRGIPVKYPRSDPATGEIVWIQKEKLDETDVRYLLESIDLDPRYIEIFETRKYVDPPLSITRFMFEEGVINADTVKTLVDLQGYRPEHSAYIAKYITEFQERLWRRRYLVTLQGGYQKGVYTGEELNTAVLDAGYTQDVATWIRANADARKKIDEAAPTAAEKPKLLSVGDLKKAYIENMISRDALATELAVRGYPFDQAELLLRLLDHEKVVESVGDSKVALSQAELVDAWKYEEISEDQLRTELQLRGLSLAEVEILIRTKKKKWGVEKGVVS